jgi:hypothetical protein
VVGVPERPKSVKGLIRPVQALLLDSGPDEQQDTASKQHKDEDSSKDAGISSVKGEPEATVEVISKMLLRRRTRTKRLHKSMLT